MKTTSLVMSVITGLNLVGYIGLRLMGQGMCDRPELVQNFDAEAYLGVWYELRRDKGITFESGECVTAEYSLNDDGSTVKVSNTQFFGFFDGTNGSENAIGEAQINQWTGGLLWVYFFAYLGGGYHILDTDYTGHAVVWTCENYGAGAFK